jgi:hypothetical protein
MIVRAAVVALALVAASTDASAEYCWMVGCDGARGWLKIAREQADVGEGIKTLFGVAQPPKEGEEMSIMRFAFLRGHRSPDLDREERGDYLGAHLLCAGSRVRILGYDQGNVRFVQIEVVNSDCDRNLPNSDDAI